MSLWRAPAWRLWGLFALLTVFFVLPGPSRSLFSGIPFSSKAHVSVVALLIAALALALFPARETVRGRWLLALALICLAKVAITPALRDEGWIGQYSTARESVTPDTRVRFFRRGAQDHRIDRTLIFNDVTFALFYVNDRPSPGDWNTTPRHVRQPLRVHWIGYVDAPFQATLRTSVSANGAVSIDVDDVPVLQAVDPAQAPFSHTVAAGTHRIDIVYDKPREQKPAFALPALPLPVTAAPTKSAELRRALWAEYAIDLLGVVALLVFGAALLDAYRPISRFLFVDIWDSPDRVALLALVGIVLLSGMTAMIQTRGATVPLNIGDDPLIYEANARTILFNGLLMKHAAADAAPYYHYPVYSYALAGAHALFGEDYSSIRWFNWLCSAAAAILLWVFLRKWLTPGSLLVVRAVFGVFLYSFQAPYAHTAYTDNLYLPVTIGTVAACTRAFDGRYNGWLVLSGFITVFGAFTRPSMMLFPPFLMLALLLFWRGGVAQRIAAVGAFAGGFVAGAAPFIIRNWIVAHRLALMTSMFLMVPYFLYPPGQPGAPVKSILDQGQTAAGAIRTFVNMFATAPVFYLDVEIRKILFTLGLTRARFSDCNCPETLFIFPLLFALALWTKRMPRPVRVAVSAFAASHVAAMVVATPWSYGYKNVLPLHAMFLAGAAFLLPQRGDAAVREVAIPRELSPGRRRVSVVLPTYNEKDSIRQVILDFFGTGAVDEVIVVNNNAASGTSDEVFGTGAREVIEPRQGYGRAIRRGMDEATGDYIVICEPDGTFSPARSAEAPCLR